MPDFVTFIQKFTVLAVITSPFFYLFYLCIFQRKRLVARRMPGLDDDALEELANRPDVKMAYDWTGYGGAGAVLLMIMAAAIWGY